MKNMGNKKKVTKGNKGNKHNYKKIIPQSVKIKNEKGEIYDLPLPANLQYKIKVNEKQRVNFHKKKKSCDKKRGSFYDACETNKRAAAINATGPDKPMRAYQCDFCKRYHLSTMSEVEYGNWYASVHGKRKDMNEERNGRRTYNSS